MERKRDPPGRRPGQDTSSSTWAGLRQWASRLVGDPASKGKLLEDPEAVQGLEDMKDRRSRVGFRGWVEPGLTMYRTRRPVLYINRLLGHS